MIKALVLGLVLSFQSFAFADAASDAVANDVKKISGILLLGSEAAKASALCQVVRSRVDIATVSRQWLGTYAKLTSDADGVRNFTALVPAILVTDVYDLIAGQTGQPYDVSPNSVPRGSSRVGVTVSWGSKTLVVSVNKASLKLLDIQWNSYSLVNRKTGNFQSRLQALYKQGGANSQPVTALIKELIQSGKLVRCN